MQKSKGDGLFPGVGKGPTGVIKSILDTSRTEGKAREEIFVDIVEKISCTFSSSGHIQTSQIDGAIQVGQLTCLIISESDFHRETSNCWIPKQLHYLQKLSLVILLITSLC